MFWPKWRGPRKRSRTRARGFAHALGRVRVAQQGAHPLAEGTEVARPDQAAGAAVFDLVLDPADRVATTGRPFHIASETVSPKPSARLFCATTSARR